MIAPLKTVHSLNKSVAQSRSTAVIISILIGSLIGGLFSVIWPNLNGGAMVAFWGLGVALASVTMSLAVYRRHRLMRWDLLLGGQIVAAVSAVLLFIASL